MRIRVKKLFNNCVSIRDYLVKQAIEKKENIVVCFKDKRMILTPERLKQGKKNNLKLQSKWGGKTYDLIDFEWRPNDLQLF